MSIDFERYNPFRRPEWRHERVLQMVSVGHPGRSTRRDDEYVTGLRKFILRYRAYSDLQRNRLAYENPGLYWAYQLYVRKAEHDKRMTTMIESRLLANQSDEEIAAEISTLPEVVEWYEALFFCVRDRLKAHDWVIDQVLMPALDGDEEDAEAAVTVPTAPRALSEPFFDATIKFFGYFGGSLVLDYVISGFRRGVMASTREEISAWFDGHANTRIKQRTAMAANTFEVNRYNVMELFNVHARLQEIEKGSDSAENKHDQYYKSLQSMLTEMPWATGDKGEANVKGTPLEEYDKNAAELRDGEVLVVSSGRKPSTIEGVSDLRLPPPSKRAGQEDQQHAQNAQ